MNVVTTITLAMLVVAAAINLGRAIRPGSIVDRAIGLDGVAAAVICGLAATAVRQAEDVLIDIALVGGLLGFLTIASVSRYVARRNP